MIEIPLIDELREVRRRLSEAQAADPVRYAAMLREVGRELPGKYVDRNLGSKRGDQPEPEPVARKQPTDS